MAKLDKATSLEKYRALVNSLKKLYPTIDAPKVEELVIRTMQAAFVHPNMVREVVSIASYGGQLLKQPEAEPAPVSLTDYTGPSIVVDGFRLKGGDKIATGSFVYRKIISINKDTISFVVKDLDGSLVQGNYGDPVLQSVKDFVEKVGLLRRLNGIKYQIQDAIQ